LPFIAASSFLIAVCRRLQERQGVLYLHLSVIGTPFVSFALFRFRPLVSFVFCGTAMDVDFSSFKLVMLSDLRLQFLRAPSHRRILASVVASSPCFADTGIGIPKDALSKLFKMFSQVRRVIAFCFPSSAVAPMLFAFRMSLG
jgi:hypothetical protein